MGKRQKWAISSGVEHHIHTVGVASSKLASPTIDADSQRNQSLGLFSQFIFMTYTYASLGSIFFAAKFSMLKVLLPTQLLI